MSEYHKHFPLVRDLHVRLTDTDGNFSSELFSYHILERKHIEPGLVEDFPRSIRKTYTYVWADPWSQPRDYKAFSQIEVTVTYSKLSYEDLGWV